MLCNHDFDHSSSDPCHYHPSLITMLCVKFHTNFSFPPSLFTQFCALVTLAPENTTRKLSGSNELSPVSSRASPLLLERQVS